MSLLFSGTTDKVDCGSASVLDNLDPLTYAAWVYPTSLVSNASIFGKAVATVNQIRLSGTGGDLAFSRGRGSGGAQNASYITNSTPFATTNKWYFVAVTFATASTPAVHIYTGSLTAAAVEATYGTSTNGTGAVRDDSASNMVVGNLTLTSTTPFTGRIAFAYIWNRELSLGEVRSQQFSVQPQLGPVLFMPLGFGSGTGTQGDLSGNGNSGSVTGAAQADHVPLAAFCGDEGAEPYQAFRPVWAAQKNIVIGGGVYVP